MITPRASRMAGWLSLAAVLLIRGVAPGETVLFPAGSIWRYLDNGSDQGTAWITPAFNDSGWASGPAPLGYGHAPLERTVISYGGVASDKYITSYFRMAFTVTNASSYAAFRLRLLRDDGIVLYLNGTEILRNNMPGSAITWKTLASTKIGNPDETNSFELFLPAAGLAEGTNVIAAEVHQITNTSSDVEFDLALSGLPVPLVTRGPYLQRSSRDSIVIRWRTAPATDSRVVYGTNLAALDFTTSLLASNSEHIVTLTNLLADTKYYYAVGTTGSLLAASDPGQYFFTHPQPGTPKSLRIWVIGDAGTADANQAAVRDAFYAFNGTNTVNAWLQLGDNAYNSGTDAEYQSAVFDMYPTLLRSSVTWATLGNHETAQSTAYVDTYPYFDIFTLPTAGEAGGVPSGTEHYYSFDLGMVHFVCLDSMTASRATNGAMATWLRSDLAVTTSRWVIAFWHHPPYSKGSHDSDTDTWMTEMRENILPILETNGVDLVLSGHSHSYERSMLVNGHYGVSATFNPVGHVVQSGGGKESNGVGAYHKPDGLGEHPVGNRGAVYAVAGSSGQTTVAPLNHPAMYYSELALGSVVLDFASNRLDAIFLRDTGATNDAFTIIKDGTSPPRLGNLVPLPNGDVQFTVLCRGYRTNIIEVSSNLVAGNTWRPLDTNTTTNSFFVFTHAGGLTNSVQFYRVRSP
ncbi:MAG: metallophosphoesterase family protein [bacterium]